MATLVQSRLGRILLHLAAMMGDGAVVFTQPGSGASCSWSSFHPSVDAAGERSHAANAALAK